MFDQDDTLKENPTQQSQSCVAQIESCFGSCFEGCYKWTLKFSQLVNSLNFVIAHQSFVCKQDNSEISIPNFDYIFNYDCKMKELVEFKSFCFFNKFLENFVMSQTDSFSSITRPDLVIIFEKDFSNETMNKLQSDYLFIDHELFSECFQNAELDRFQSSSKKTTEFEIIHFVSKSFVFCFCLVISSKINFEFFNFFSIFVNTFVKITSYKKSYFLVFSIFFQNLIKCSVHEKKDVLTGLISYFNELRQIDEHLNQLTLNKQFSLAKKDQECFIQIKEEITEISESISEWVKRSDITENSFIDKLKQYKNDKQSSAIECIVSPVFFLPFIKKLI
jgi:hypothetical protein